MDLSDDGEIKDDFSDISEEEYFDNIANKIEKRKLELELLNEIVDLDTYDDYAKENRYESNYRNKQNFDIPSPRNSSKKSNGNHRKERNRKNSEIRNTRSYRASSIFSTGYTLPKRKKQRRRKKNSNINKSQRYLNSSSSDESVIEVIKDESDDEVLALRLQALTSKQEVKELIEKPTTIIAATRTPTSSPIESLQNTNEEEELRIAALHSAILKKKDHFRKRKQLRKMENERPYSPTDKFDPFEVEMDLSNSLPNSPFHEAVCEDINEEIDMDISNSPAVASEIILDDNSESCDMEIVNSPHSPNQLIKSSPSEIFDQSEQNENEEEEEALRSMLLSSLNGGSKKKKAKEKEEDDCEKENEQDYYTSTPSSPQLVIAKNLKMAVERIKQQKQQVSPTIIAQQQHKSGTKTIKMILEEQKNKKMTKGSDIPKEALLIIEEDSSKGISDSEGIIANEQHEILMEPTEGMLIEKIVMNEKRLLSADELLLEKASLALESTDSSFSTITDTKNIPLLTETTKKSLDKRLVTSLDSIMKPVSPLIISLRNESSEDEYDIQEKQKASRKKYLENSTDVKPANDFAKNLDNFLKNIRSQQEKSENSKTATLTKSSTSTSLDIASSNSQIISPKTSAVKHLPLSSQLEYEKLVKKMKDLQEAKQQKQKSGTLKRTKSSSSNIDKSTQASQNSVKSDSIRKSQNSSPEANEKEAKNKNKETENKSSKIDETLEKIPLLDFFARGRLIEKTENNYLTHSKNLLESTESNVKLLDENTLEFKRRDKIELKIVELEKSLAKYKNLLRIVNGRIKTNTPKIVQSQRDMIKLRNHQFKFGQICKKVGQTVRGDSYRLPSYESEKIVNNFTKITEKTAEIHKAIQEQSYTSKQFKILSDKVKEFIPQLPTTQPEKSNTKCLTPNENAQIETIKENSARAIVRSVSQLIAACNKNNDEEAEEILEDNNIDEIKMPETHSHVKRVLENRIESPTSKKKVKMYESPLEFLKQTTKIDGNKKSVNQIVCPFAMEGSCNDRECKYLHL